MAIKMKRIQEDFNLGQQVRNFEHEKFKGRKGIETLYEITIANYLEPEPAYRTEKGILEDTMNHCTDSYKILFDLYFYIHPEKAKEIIDEQKQKCQKGWKRIVIEPFIIFTWSYCKNDRYIAAKKRVIYEKEKRD